MRSANTTVRVGVTIDIGVILVSNNINVVEWQKKKAIRVLRGSSSSVRRHHLVNLQDHVSRTIVLYD